MATFLTQAQEKSLHKTIDTTMETSGWNVQQTMNALKIPANEQEKYAKQI